jgi:outer membrane scaffolding protein for murein synthesis (MipA/OmpV family)
MKFNMLTSTHGLCATLLATSLGLAAFHASAQGFDAVRLSSAAPGKDGGAVGLGVISMAEYQGSDQRKALVLPLLNYQWANGWFAGVSNGIGYNFSESPQTQYGLRLTADLGREAGSNKALQGMGDIDPSAEGGAYFNVILPQGLFLSSSVRYGAGEQHRGRVVDLSASYSMAISTNWRLAGGTGVSFANADYMQSYFGVTQAQSAASGHAAYTAGSGVRDIRANMALIVSIDPKTSVMAVLSASRLQGAAKNSPLTQQRSTGSGLVAISYAF